MGFSAWYVPDVHDSWLTTQRASATTRAGCASQNAVAPGQRLSEVGLGLGGAGGTGTGGGGEGGAGVGGGEDGLASSSASRRSSRVARSASRMRISGGSALLSVSRGGADGKVPGAGWLAVTTLPEVAVRDRDSG